MSKTKRTGKSLLETSNTASTATMLTLGFSESQAKRLMRVRRTLPMMEDSKAPCIDARKLCEHLGKPHKRFNMWADSYIKPILGSNSINAEISAKVTEVKREHYSDTLLETAVATWEDGWEIPLDIEVELLGRGYDVAGLRKLHLIY